MQLCFGCASSHYRVVVLKLVSRASYISFSVYVCVDAYVVVKTRLESFSFVTYERIITLNCGTKNSPVHKVKTTLLHPKPDTGDDHTCEDHTIHTRFIFIGSILGQQSLDIFLFSNHVGGFPVPEASRGKSRRRT